MLLFVWQVIVRVPVCCPAILNGYDTRGGCRGKVVYRFDHYIYHSLST